MSENRIDFTLSLIPITNPKDLQGTSVSSNQDDWLNNDDANLLQENVAQESKIKDESGLHQVLDQLSHRDAHRIIKKETLEIKSTSNGFSLIDGDKYIVLQDGDIIHLPTVLFRVCILQDHIVKYDRDEESNEQIISPPVNDDIWSSTHDSNYQGNRFADPFAATGKGIQHSMSPQQDPLDFLYDPNSKSKTNLMQASGYELSPPIAAEYSNTSNRDSAGNVLNDLGIDETTSTITQRNYNSGKNSYLEQSPMDMLDEYLDLNETMRYDANISNLPPQSFHTQEPYSVNSSDHYIPQNTAQHTIQSSDQAHSKQATISHACKKLLKVFVD